MSSEKVSVSKDDAIGALGWTGLIVFGALAIETLTTLVCAIARSCHG